jgi:hypothetical protein
MSLLTAELWTDRTTRPAAARSARRSPDRLVVAALVLVVVAVHGVGIMGFPALGDDEGTYTAQAWAVQHGSLAHYTYWYDHPPLGWIQLAALSWLPHLLVPGALAVQGTRLVMLAITVVDVVLLYVVARRLTLGRPFAGAAALLGTLSPLAVVLQRQVYLDNVAVPWLLAAFVLASSPRRHLWHHVAAGAAFAVAVLCKETALLVLPGLLWTAWRHTDRRNRAFALAGFASTAVLGAAVYPLFALLRNELVPGAGHVSLADGVLFQLVNRRESGSLLDPASSVRGVIDGWLYYDEWLIGCGVVAAALAFGIRRLRPTALTVIVLVAIVLKPGNYLPTMFVIVALPFLALAVAGVADAAWARLQGAPEGRPRSVSAAAFAVACAALAGAALPAWIRTDLTMMTTDVTRPAVTAVRWMEANVPRDSRVLVDDALWLDLVHAGFDPRAGAVWFYKLDTDPAYRTVFPLGWRQMEYVVSSPQLRDSVTGSPELANCRAALAHSTVVASFGVGTAAVAVRRVDPRAGTP